MDTADKRIDELLDALSTGVIEKLAMLREIARIASEKYTGTSPEEIFRCVESTHYEKVNIFLKHNDRRNFKDLLWLITYRDEMIEVKQRSQPSIDQKITCFEAFSATQHTINDAATKLRQRLGTGRAKGGGRKKKLPKCATKAGLKAFMEEFEENKPWIFQSPEFMEMLEIAVRVYYSDCNN